MSELPKGWVEATLEELCNFNPRHNSLINRKTAISFVPMPSVCDREGVILPHETRPLEEVWKGYTHFQDNDVIFAKITPCMENGKIALAIRLHNGIACGSTEFHVLRSLGVVLPEYLWRFIRQVDFRKEAERHMAGAVGQRRVPVQFLKETNLPVPPLNEQRRIVAKLDSLFARSRRAREELGRVSGLCDRYKQAVLAAAFRGDLTADWRENNNSLSWHFKILQDIANVIDPHPSHRTPKEFPQGIPYVGIGDLDKSGNFDFANARKVSKEILREHRDRYTLSEGDLIFGKIGTLGKPTRLPIGCEYTLSANVILVQPIATLINSSYLMYFLQSSETMKEILSQTNSTSQAAFGIKKMKALNILMPSLMEQNEIVQRIEKLFKVIDLMELEYQKASKLCDRLEQATLAKAFRGELVPQDPNDEPAAALLERICAERQEQPKGKAVKSPRKPRAKTPKE